MDNAKIIETLIVRVEALVGKSSDLDEFINKLRSATVFADRLNRDLRGLAKAKLPDLTAISASGGSVDLTRQVAFQRQKVELAKRGVGLLDVEIRRLKEIEARLEKILTLEGRITAERAKRPANTAPTVPPGLITVPEVVRAPLAGWQAQIMANYAVLGGLAGGITSLARFSVEFESSLADLGAITGSTDGQLRTLGATILTVAGDTKFGIDEVTKATTVLAQAGFSVADIQRSLLPVVQLAAVTGADLTKAVDIVTTTITAFDLTVNDATRIVDTFAGALNLSKLNIDQLALGFQYVASTAAQAGVTFDEITALMAGMADAGIRSGSTMGTGLRMVLTELEKPSEALKGRLASLGLTLEDVDVRTKGVVGVLRTLRDSGFTASDAMKTMQVRTAAATTALLGQLNAVERFQVLNQFAASASEGAERQMLTLKNSAVALGNQLQGLTAKAVEPLQTALASFLRSLSDVVEAIDGPLTRAVIAGAVPAFGVAMVAALASTVRGLLAFTIGAGAATGATNGLTAAMARNPAIMAITLAVAGLSAAYSILTERSRELGSALDQTKTRINEVTDEITANEKAGEAIETVLQRLTARHTDLAEGSAALRAEVLNASRQFGSFGLSLDGAGESVDSLIGKLRNLRTNLAAARLAPLDLSVEEQSKALALLGDKVNSRPGMTSGWGPFLDREGTQSWLAGLPPGMADAFTRLADPKGFAAEISAAQAGNLDPLIRLLAGDGTNGRLDQTLKTLADAATNAPQEVRDVVTLAPDTLRTLNEILASAVKLGAATADRDALAEGLKIGDTIRGLDGEIGGLSVALADLGKQLAGVSDPAERSRLLDQSGFGAVLSDLRGRLTSDVVAGGRAIGADVDVNLARLEAQFSDYQAGIIAEADEYTAVVLKARLDRLRRSGRRDEGLSVGRALARHTSGIDRLLAEGKVTPYGDTYTITEKGQASLVDATKAIAAFDAAMADAEAEWKGFTRQAGTATRDLRSRLKDLTPKSTLEDVRRVQAEGLDLIARDTGADLDAIKAALAEQPAVLPDLAGLNTEAHHMVDEFIRATLRAVGRSLDVVKSIEDEIKAAELAFDTQMAEIEARERVAARPAQNFRALSDAFGNIGADSLASVASRAASAAQYDPLSFTQEKLAAVEARLASMERARDAGQRRLDVAKREGAGPSVIDALEVAQKKATDDLTAARAKLAETTARLKAEESAALAVREADTASLGDSLAATLDLYRASLDGAGQSVNVAFSDTMVAGLESARMGLTTFLSDVTNGTKSAGDAFRDLGANMLQAMQNVVMSKLAEQFLSLVLTAAGVGFNGGGMVSKSGTRMASGGFVRAAAGYAVPTRDSVPILAQPGEFIMRRSAVDLIGSDTLAGLNAMGNRVVSQSRSIRQLPEKAEDVAPINVWVVSPDQKPGMGPRDVLVTIAEDAARGGTFKKLVKQIQRGEL